MRVDVKSAFEGTGYSLTELTDQLVEAGWELQKLNFKKDAYYAKAKAPHGETIERFGRTPETALYLVLRDALKQRVMRGAHKVAVLDYEYQLGDVAKQYAQAPVYDHKAAVAYKTLADELAAQADVIKQQIDIETSPEPHPYETIHQMSQDIRDKDKFTVSTAHIEHPFWNQQQVLNYRIVRDVLGHCAMGAGYDYSGIVRAAYALMPLLSPEAQKALFTEMVGREAYRTFYSAPDIKKVTLLDTYDPTGDNDEAMVPGRMAAFDEANWPDINNLRPWQPGHYGKGLVINGKVYGWSVGDFDADGRPWHADVANQLGMRPGDEGVFGYLIQPGGGVDPTYNFDSPGWKEALQQFVNEVPGTYSYDFDDMEKPEVDWSIHSKVEEWRSVEISLDELEPWEMGSYGKGWILPDGRNVIWRTSDAYGLRAEDGFPSHANVGTQLGITQENMFDIPAIAIDNYGTLRTYNTGTEEVEREVINRVKAEHPDVKTWDEMYYGDEEEESWTVSKRAGMEWYRQEITLNELEPWQLGTHGKGLIFNDLSILTWKTREEHGLPKYDGFPAHVTVRKALMAENPNALPSKGYIKFYPDGAFQLYGVVDPLDEQKIRESIRNIPGTRDKFEEDNWSVTAKTAKSDPNYQYDTGVVPFSDNAYLMGDPLEAQKVRDTASLIDTNWSQLVDENGEPDLPRMRQAIANAFRVAILSQRKGLRENAMHYQDISHIPVDVTDWKVYQKALTDKRKSWNAARGRDEEAHKPYWKDLQILYRLVGSQYPDYTNVQVKEYVDDEVMHMRAEIEEYLSDTFPNLDSDQLENKVDAELAKRLKAVTTKEETEEEEMDNQMTLLGADKSRGERTLMEPDELGNTYGAWMTKQTQAVANISKYVDYLLKAALEDVREHDGAGHHFRSATLGLDIPGVNAKVASFAWLLLQPLTSELATVDVHMNRVLGYPAKQTASKRDYFQYERELKAGRDAAGYGHMPLGQFQWGMWDYIRTGPGSHQDHSPLKTLNPQSYNDVQWHESDRAKVDPTTGEEVQWSSPWWDATLPARQKAKQEYVEQFGHLPQTRYPFVEVKKSVPNS